MEIPKTTEEFEAVLKAFKEKDANGNGDPNDEIPFSADPNNLHIEAMTGWFGLPMDRNGLGIKDEKPVYGGVS
ncbi:MAG TPA: sugar ABC transporter substrate-binding protein, partial [Lachnospiraceae bacterium]|nr:sugar ABC transporter substrate-binding protein [Lachnospiraceae bacterium]